jgi:hypothetical protein
MRHPRRVESPPGVALGRAGTTVFRGVTSLATGPASERGRSARHSDRNGFAVPESVMVDPFFGAQLVV